MVTYRAATGIIGGRSRVYRQYSDPTEHAFDASKKRTRVKSVTNSKEKTRVAARLTVRQRCMQYGLDDPATQEILEMLELDDSVFDGRVLAKIKIAEFNHDKRYLWVS